MIATAEHDRTAELERELRDQAIRAELLYDVIEELRALLDQIRGVDDVELLGEATASETGGVEPVRLDAALVRLRETQTQDFTLTAPQSLPSDVTVTSLLGESNGGIPTVYWDAPFTITYPADLPTEPANTEIAYFTSVAVYNAGNDNPDATPISAGSAVLLVSYDANGTPSVIAQYPDPTGGPDPTLTFTTASSTAQLAHTATAREKRRPLARPAETFGPPELMPIQVAEDPVLNRLIQFEPTVQAQVPSVNQTAHGPVTVTINKNKITVPPGSTVTLKSNGDIMIKTPPQPCAKARDVHGRLAPQADFCPPQFPPPQCTPSCQPNGPNGGGSSSGGGMYIDPSGEVRTKNGVPVPGARVVLRRSNRRHGRFAQVPNRSRIMSPANRRNPFTTGAAGLFGWDVLPGFYQITAQHPGCTATRHKKLTRSRTLEIPPPALDLRLTLSCPRLTRTSSRTTPQARTVEHGRIVLITITVKGARHHHPTGLITFHAGATTRTIPVSPRNGKAVLVIPASAAKRFSVRYQGDGYNTPSTGHAKRR